MEHFRGSGQHKYINKRCKQGGIEALATSVSYRWVGGHCELEGGEGTSVDLSDYQILNYQTPNLSASDLIRDQKGERGLGLNYFVANFVAVQARKGWKSSQDCRERGALGRHRGVGPRQAFDLIFDGFR
jgi:hypothetical protein